MIKLNKRKQTATLINSTSEQLIYLSENPIFIHLVDGKIALWNLAAEKLYGYSEKEINGNSVTLLSPPEKFDEFSSLLAKIDSGQKIENYSTHHRTKEGKLIKVVFSIIPIIDSNENVIGTITNIQNSQIRNKPDDSVLNLSQITQQDPKNSSSEQLLENSYQEQIGSWVWDIQANVVFWSDKLCKIYGKSQRSMRSTFNEFIDNILINDRNNVREKLDNARIKKNAIALRYRILRTDGSIRVLILNVTLTVDNDKVVSMRGTCHDITEFTQIENELRKSKLELEYRVLGRTQEISDANAKLMRALHEKELLLNEVHHRVKNNLQIISSLVKLQFEQESDPQEAIESIQNRLKAIALVHEKLYSSKDISKIDFQKYAFDLFTNMIRSSSYNMDIKLITDIQAIKLDIEVSTNLGLILNELISNAIKHGFQNTKEKTINISLKNQGSYRFQFANSGVALTEINFDNPKTMGMVVITSLVEQMDGAIQVVNKTDSTEFIITFPEKDHE